MASEFIPGDLVRLKSGGPDMTVMNVDGGSAHCIWFPVLENGFARAPTEQWFPFACLTPPEPATREAGNGSGG